MMNLKRYMPKKLFTRGIVMIATPILLLQLVIVYIILERHWDQVSDELSKNTAREVLLLLAEPEAGKRQALARRLDLSVRWLPQQALPQQPPISRLDFVYRVFAPALKKEIKNPIVLDTQTLKGRVKVLIAVRGNVLEVIIPLNRVYAVRVYQLIVWISLTGVLVMIVAILFLRNQVRPIQRLAITAKKFGQGLEVPNFTPTGSSEVREAGEAFLTMRNNIRTHLAQRTDMLSAISHDLRTAITRLKLQTALLPPSNERQALEGDIGNMEKMLLGYLDFARGLGQNEKPVLVDLVAQLVALSQPYQDQVKLHAPHTLTMRLSVQAIRRALNNVLHNGITYGKQVEITLTQDQGSVCITFDDCGTGIPESQREQAFQPFQRLDEARNQTIVGTGLGLSIARDIIHAAGGTIKLQDAPSGGLRVEVSLPY